MKATNLVMAVAAAVIWTLGAAAAADGTFGVCAHRPAPAIRALAHSARRLTG